MTGLIQETLSLKKGSKLVDLMGKLFETYRKNCRLLLDFGNSHVVLIKNQPHEMLMGMNQS